MAIPPYGAAHGAGRGAIFRQLVIENILLGAAAGIIGTGLGFAALDLVARTLLETKPEASVVLSGDLGLLPIALVLATYRIVKLDPSVVLRRL